jgi:hypothetical protein
VQAAPGLGYSYRWDSDGDGTFDSEKFGTTGQVTLTLEEGATREVHLQVKNAFGRVRSGSFEVTRPLHDASAPSADALLPAGARPRPPMLLPRPRTAPGTAPVVAPSGAQLLQPVQQPGGAQ